jgi:hypothetical protein
MLRLMRFHDRLGHVPEVRAKRRHAWLGAWSVLSSALALVGACSTLDEFQTDERTVFRGAIIGSQGAAGDASFIRRGFPSRTELELALNPQTIYRDPGRIRLWLDQPGGGTWHTDAPLVPLAPLAHDQLSQYSVPGEGRLRNYIFGATLFAEGPRGEDPEALDATPRDINVFVSLMGDGTVEVRLMTPMADLFGVFTQLQRQRPR